MNKIYMILGLAILTALSTNAQTPTAYYPLNGNGDDASGNGLHGVVTDALPIEDRDNNPSSAMMFTGAANIKVPDTAAFSFGERGAFTISAWFRSGSSNIYKAMVSTGTAAWQKGFLLGLNWESGKIIFAIGASGFFNSANAISMVSVNTYNDNLWHFVSVSVNPATDKAFMYVDGSVVPIKYFGAFGTTGGTISADELELDFAGVNYSLHCTEPQLMIGTTTSLQNFEGDLDEIRIYNQALTVAEINDIYAGLPSYIAEELNQNKLLLFPNPSAGSITLNHDEVLELVQIFDLQGKIVYQANPFASNFQIETNLIQGMYLVKIKTKNGEETKKLLVK